jgi:hypothetical protein
MNKATRVYASTFGAVMALAGIEHGLGEILQGNLAPPGALILSWPDSEFFSSLGGEPALTIVPNLLLSGILTVLVTSALLLWAVLFIHKKNGGLVMVLLSTAMLLVGGGIFPPIFGVLIGVVATRIHSPLLWWRAHLSNDLRRFLTRLWPWSYTLCILAWLAVLPGIPLLEGFSGPLHPASILAVLFLALGTLILNIISAFSVDLNSPGSIQNGAAAAE